MIEKEEKAIKNLKEIIDLSKEEIENNDENTTAILDITDLKSLAIVLDLLEQKDKEIAEERIKYLSSNLNNTIKQRQKEDEQLSALNEGWKIELEQKDKEIEHLKNLNQHQSKDITKAVNYTFELNKEIEEKDKIIDLMARYINSTDKDEDVCRETGDTYNCTEYRDCEECIIEFFKKKASEENE